MFEQPVSEKQCRACEACKPTQEFRFSARRMRYLAVCRGCENGQKAARRKSTTQRVDPTWPRWEEAIIHADYPRGGMAACRVRLPHRTARAIRSKAHAMDVKYVHTPKAAPVGKQVLLANVAVPLPAPHDYTDADRAWMAHPWAALPATTLRPALRWAA